MKKNNDVNANEIDVVEESSDLRGRIILLMQNLNLRPTGFARTSGISQGLVNNFLKGAAESLSYKVLKKILTAFPMVSAEWLMLGKEGMFKDEKANGLGKLINQETEENLKKYMELTEKLKEENTELLRKIMFLSEQLLNIKSK